MRVTSAIYVSALVRRVQSHGGFATVLRRGTEEAGAVHIVWRSRSGQLAVYSPSMNVGSDGERMFALRNIDASEDEVEVFIEREAAFDTDVWVVEIEGDFIEPPFDVSVD